MLRMFKRKYKVMMMAWVMLLSFLPQVLVKGFHQHSSSLDKVECQFSVRAAQAQPASAGSQRDGQAREKHHDQQRKQLAHHQKQSSDEGTSDKANGHDCAICHYLISPFTPPTFATFSFVAPQVRVTYLQQADALHSLSVVSSFLRGPPQA